MDIQHYRAELGFIRPAPVIASVGRQFSRHAPISRPLWASMIASHAEVIAATVAGLPDSLGGIRMAIRVAELARAGLTPHWMPGVVPRCVPVETKRNQHGERSTTIVVGTERVPTRGKWRTVEVLACPVTWRPHPEQITSARRGYEDWWQPLIRSKDGFWLAISTAAGGKSTKGGASPPANGNAAPACACGLSIAAVGQAYWLPRGG